MWVAFIFLQHIPDFWLDGGNYALQLNDNLHNIFVISDQFMKRFDYIRRVDFHSGLFVSLFIGLCL